VELTSLIDAMDLLLRRVVRSNVELAVSYNGAVWVRADSTLLEQVLVNLVVNASDAMPNGGRIEVRAWREKQGPLGDTACLQVSDTGVGMDEKVLAMIFDPFFTTKEHGTGLGLASSYGIIRQHGGDIVAESQPGHGTRFRVLLPSLSVGS
jgi:signal transduction histidine kinase